MYTQSAFSSISSNSFTIECILNEYNNGIDIIENEKQQNTVHFIYYLIDFALLRYIKYSGKIKQKNRNTILL